MIADNEFGALASAYSVAVSKILEKGDFALQDVCSLLPEKDSAKQEPADAGVTEKDVSAGESLLTQGKLLTHGFLDESADATKKYAWGWCLSSADRLHCFRLRLAAAILSESRLGTGQGQVRAHKVTRSQSMLYTVHCM